jgi:S-adenosylmethionine:tRNA ribosyltransferase-isomerase
LTEPRAISELALSDFAYELPRELIAQEPLACRDQSRLLVLDGKRGAISHSTMQDLATWLEPGDLLVANNSRVIPARLHGYRMPSGGAVEVLLLRTEGKIWSALGRPAKRLRPGTRLEFPARDPRIPAAVGTVVENLGEGQVRLRFADGADCHLEDYGEPPLPPYITRPLADADRYQTIYGRVPGSAAAPTAGLHFTPELLDQLRNAGIGWAEITLHVGLDTFRPVSEEHILDHRIHQEWCEVPGSVAEQIAACRARGSRVVAVGTTAARTLETLGRTWVDGDPRGYSGFTDLFILPGHRWRIVDALLTNFHLPRSTLLMLVSALAGRENVLGAYDEAVRHRYRFYSFGDAMLIR